MRLTKLLQELRHCQPNDTVAFVNEATGEPVELLRLVKTRRLEDERRIVFVFEPYDDELLGLMDK